jgi:hypothetical protein
MMIKNVIINREKQYLTTNKSYPTKSFRLEDKYYGKKGLKSKFYNDS